MSRLRVHRILAGSLIAVVLALAPAAAWAFTATLSIPNLCAGPIDVTLFSLEASNTVPLGGGAGGGSGKASIKPLVLSKAPDDCTPLLFRAVFLGQHFQTATLQVGTKKTPVLFTIQLRDVLVTDLKHEFAKNGTGAGDDNLAESVTLDAGSLTFTSGGTSVTCSQTTNSCE
ncbi:MAG TPA: type VI secretion system tube protein Hcp [Candidatus Binatia bacterium]|nr:type VI secretion system tube protein Hcp [Candidatus Binatia bacterium]